MVLLVVACPLVAALPVDDDANAPLRPDAGRSRVTTDCVDASLSPPRVDVDEDCLLPRGGEDDEE